MAGDYILSITSMMIANINRDDVTIHLSKVNSKYFFIIIYLKINFLKYYNGLLLNNINY